MAGLKHALPYLRLFQGATFVVKLSGEALEDGAALARFLEQVELLARVGLEVVLVHGGGPQTNALSARLGLPVVKVDGRRVTDAPTLEAAIAAIAGLVNTRCSTSAAAPGSPRSASPGRRRPRRGAPAPAGAVVRPAATPTVDYGYVGDVVR